MAKKKTLINYLTPTKNGAVVVFAILIIAPFMLDMALRILFNANALNNKLFSFVLVAGIVIILLLLVFLYIKFYLVESVKSDTTNAQVLDYQEEES